MNILAKFTTLSIFILLVTYAVIFYSPAVKNLISPQKTITTPKVTEIPTESPTETPAEVLETIALPKAAQTPMTTSVPVVTQTKTTPAPAPTTDTRCIITVDGSRYDVTQYRNIHSGGDIFKCGTDMSATFHSQHSAKFLDRMSQYKI